MTVQTSLFSSGDFIAGDPKTRPKTKNRCKDCHFCFQHQYSRRYTYCHLQNDRKTATLHKKIKRTDYICSRFEPTEPPF